jgi:hypothetical protein
MGAAWIAVVQQAEDGATDKSEVGDQARLGTAGRILPPKGVATPVIAVFHTGPVVSNQGNPFWIGAF